jgi:hypothetical protein
MPPNVLGLALDHAKTAGLRDHQIQLQPRVSRSEELLQRPFPNLSPRRQKLLKRRVNLLERQQKVLETARRLLPTRKTASLVA